jgi:hypothetical protein
MMIEASDLRIPDSADIDREIGFIDQGRIAGTDNFAFRKEDVQYRHGPCVIGVELSSVSRNNHDVEAHAADGERGADE